MSEHPAEVVADCLYLAADLAPPDARPSSTWALIRDATKDTAVRTRMLDAVAVTGLRDTARLTLQVAADRIVCSILESENA